MIYRAAIIGCGQIGATFSENARPAGVYTHAAAYMQCPRTELVAVCDVDLHRAQRCAERWNARSVFTDLDQLIADARPEIVSICTPDATHADVLDTVLRGPSVVGVLAEKPLALRVRDAERLVELARQRTICVAVNYGRRYSPGHARVRELVRSGELGSIRRICGLYTKGVFHNGTHWFDLVRWLVGEIVAVQSLDAAPEDEDDPALNAHLLLENGVSGILLSCDVEDLSLFELDILATDGRVRIIKSGDLIEVFSVRESEHWPGYKTLEKAHEYSGELDRTLLHAVEDLVASLESGRQPLCSGSDGLAALRVAEAVRSSAQYGVVAPVPSGAG